MRTPEHRGRAENVLGEFLRARRGLVSPEEAGLAPGRDRRVPGLRREEVALLAGVSTDYYVRLEQGRETAPSEQVLGALARTLRLDAEATEHLHRLVLPAHGGTAADDTVGSQVTRLMNAVAAVPAFVLNPALDVIAANRPARRLYGGFTRFDNLVRMIFLDATAREFYQDWDTAARGVVRHLRVTSAPFPHDDRVARVVGEVGVRSAAFAELWARHEIAARVSEDKLLHHPEVGELALHYESFAVSSAPGQHLATYQATPGSPSATGLARLSAPDPPPPTSSASTATPGPLERETR